MTTMLPERHAFFANEVSTGIKFAIVPILEPPIIAQTRMATPINRQAFPLFKLSAIRRELADLKVSRLELSGEGYTEDACTCDYYSLVDGFPVGN